MPHRLGFVGVLTLLVLAGSASSAEPVFAPGVVYGAGTRVHGVEVADFDGDGANDVVVVNNFAGAGLFHVLMNQGDGLLDPAQSYSTQGDAYFVAVGRLDGDADVDFAIPTTLEDVLCIHKNDGNGVFASHQCTGTGGGNGLFASLGDVDGDGDLDAVVVNQQTDNLGVLRNDGNGTFGSVVTYPTPQYPVATALGDLDGDDDLDVVIGCGQAVNGQLVVRLNDGDGTFGPSMGHTPGLYPHSIELVDLNGDGDLDIVTANQDSDDLSVLMGHGDGTFEAPVNYPLSDLPAGLATGDIDGDGDIDLAVACILDEQVWFLMNDGSGQFPEIVEFEVIPQPYYLKLARMDDDEDLDLVVTYNQEGTLRVYMNETPPPPTCFAFGDSNEDELVDGADLSILLALFGQSVAQQPLAALADFNGDGFVNAADLSVLLTNFAEPCAV